MTVKLQVHVYLATLLADQTMNSWRLHKQLNIIYIYIYIYICNIYSTLTGLIYKNIDPRFSVQGCDIARACEGYITSEDTKPRFYIVLYKNCKCTIYNILYADRLKIHRSIYKNIRPNHIKRLPW